MCYYITLAVPARHERDVLDAYGREWQLERTRNPSVEAALPDGFVPLLMGAGACCCGFYTRSAAAERAKRLSHKRRKYERLGWSEAKIRRAIGGETKPQPGDGLHPSVLELIESLHARCGPIAFVVHFYSGKVETERFELPGAETWEPAALRERASAVAEDTLHLVGGGKSLRGGRFA